MKKTPEISSTFCVSPWMEIALTSDSLLCLCCYAHPIRDTKGRAYNLVEDRMEDYWNSWGLREVRSKMLAGEKIPACQQCYYDESIGKNSRRLDFNKVWFDDKHYGIDILDRVKKSRTSGYRCEKPPLRLDIRPTYLHNLKSHEYESDNNLKAEREQKEGLELKENINGNHFRINNPWQKNKKIWKTIHNWSSEAKNLCFAGEEPTLVKEIWEFIDYLKEKDLAKNISLEFSTNGNQKLDKFIGLFKSFRSIIIKFNVDGFKEVNEYIKHPSQWTEVKNNIINLLKNTNQNHHKDFYFIPTVQIYNILDLPRLLTWFNKLNLNYYFNTCVQYDFLCMDNLPNNVKKTALWKLKEYESACEEDNPNELQIDSVKNVLNSEEKPGIEKHLKNFYKHIKLLDRKRGSNFEEIFPELNALLHADGRWRA